MGNRSISCGSGFQITRSFRTSDQASTSRDTVFGPFWTTACAELSAKSWLPTKTDSPESGSRWLSTSSNDADQFSRSFKAMAATDSPTNSQKTSWRCSPTSPPNITDDVRIVARKIRIHPTPAQKQILKQFCGADRHFWNRAKEFTSSASDEAWSERCSQLDAAYEPVCIIANCHQPVVDEGAHRRKARYLCDRHMSSALGGTSPKFTKRVRKLEAMDITFKEKGCQCLASACSEYAVEGAFYCVGHGILQHKAPYRPVPASVYSSTTLKAALLVPDSELPEERAWYRTIPYDTRDMALRRFSKAMSSFFEVRKSNPNALPPDFRSKNDRRQMFSVDHRAIKYTGRGVVIFPSLKLGALCVRKRGRNKAEEMRRRCPPGKSQCAADVVRDSAGRWYVVQPFHIAAKESDPIWQSQSYRDAFIDPGARTFGSFWSPDGVAGKLGDDLYPIIKNKLFRADHLTSETARLRNIPRGTRGRRVRRRLRRLSAKSQALRTKVHDIIRDLHHKAARFLCENFKAIHIGNTHGGQVCGLGGRTINSKAVRNLMTFALAEFHGYMECYAKARGVHFYVTGEEYTTQTCTSCGDRKDRGSVKVINCSVCETKVDRDIAASRNLGLKIAMS